MPESKPMKMQWLTVDGRQVPSILPNHWNEQKNDWDITGTKNPLPVANYTQNASGVWLPTSKDNPVPTQLTGSIAEIGHAENLVIPAKSSLTIIERKKRDNFKSLRAHARWEVATNFELIVSHRLGDTPSSSASNTIIESNQIIASGKADVVGEYYDIRIVNNEESERTLRYCSVIGVK